MSAGQFTPKERETSDPSRVRSSYPDVAYQVKGCDQIRSIEEVIRDRFAYHPPTVEQQQRYAILRTDFINLAVRITAIIRPGPDRDAAIEQLHIAMMLANRAIALE